MEELSWACPRDLRRRGGPKLHGMQGVKLRWTCSACVSLTTRPARCRGSKPQGRHGWLHCLVGHRQQLGREGVQVDLVSQPGAEGLDGLGRVVLAAVEAP